MESTPLALNGFWRHLACCQRQRQLPPSHPQILPCSRLIAPVHGNNWGYYTYLFSEFFSRSRPPIGEWGAAYPPASLALHVLRQVSVRGHAQALDDDGLAGCHPRSHQDLLLTCRSPAPLSQPGRPALDHTDARSTSTAVLSTRSPPPTSPMTRAFTSSAPFSSLPPATPSRTSRPSPPSGSLTRSG